MSAPMLLPRRTIGGYTLYQRKPKPDGCSRYCVGTAARREMLNFNKYAEAMAWLKRNEENQKMYRQYGTPLPSLLL